ncbi:MAG: FAD-dependent oxidoreductase [Myxococcota bacterium]
MAKTKWARVVRHQHLGADIHRIHCIAEEDLNYVAGNYVILRSTVRNPEKPEDVLKRAYSISSAPDASSPRDFHFTIINTGATSKWLSDRRKGDRLEFSGPWGKKFRAQPDDPDSVVHLFATGTGFSPIGAMALSRTNNGRSPVNLWWQTPYKYDEGVLELLKSNNRFRVSVGEDLVGLVPADSKALYFFAGDGEVIVPLCSRLLSEGVPPQQLRTEYFFNKPPKS